MEAQPQGLGDAPNNATIAIVGDFQADSAKAWLARYFGGIPQGRPIERPTVAPPVLTAETRLVYEDRVQVPRDREQPGANLRVRQLLPQQPDKRFLRNVLRGVGISGEPVKIAVQRRIQRLEQAVEIHLAHCAECRRLALFRKSDFIVDQAFQRGT